MICRRPFYLLFLFLLVLCLLTGPASSFGYVWCVSADGHATLETAFDGDCGKNAPALPAVNFPGSALTADAGDCGPCLDISSSHQWGSPRTFDDSRHLAPPVILPRAVFVIASDAALQPINNKLAIEPAPRIPEPILLHRTTVLLI